MSAPLAAGDLGRVHLVGIGGAGMSGIARVLLARGIPVSGSDAKDSRVVAELRVLGAQVSVGHRAANVDEVDTVVVSSAIRETNVELRTARERGLRILLRADALAVLMAGRRRVAVAGTHGKTTTTSMLTVAAFHCGVDPSFAIGGDLNEAASNAHHGSGDLFIVEADESDGSFLVYSPHAAVVTNVEADHLDHYADDAAVFAAFEDFVATLAPDGFLVACADDAGAARLVLAARSRGVDVRTYGTGEDADLRLEDVVVSGTTSSWTPVLRGRRLPRVVLAVPGRHLALNSAAALLTGIGLGLPERLVVEGLAGYTGVRRRMELKGTAAGVRVYDDYAHHPTEVTAQLLAAREVVGSGRLVVAFQPHRYSRTLAFAEGFGLALGLADDVVVMEVYAAGEDPVPGVTGATVAAHVPLPAARVRFEPSWSAVPAELARRAGAGDLVLTLGAGDVTQVGPEVLRLLEQR
ncbi:MAG TPA: UDP-N-acetylmuramate--L-alanine ligase [Mycobacteriales bacterium]|jgi:UDP-N-acetylmuramate--alanine ligase|nr:UDP-N-acetylmuramate--L-alanine ligase [Mycobacteriales bacterium]